MSNPFLYLQAVLFQPIQFSISIVFLFTKLNVKTVLFQAIQFSINTQFSSILPIDRALSVATNQGYSRPWRNGRENGTPHSPKIQHFCNLTIRLFSVISRILVGWRLTICSEAADETIHFKDCQIILQEGLPNCSSLDAIGFKKLSPSSDVLLFYSFLNIRLFYCVLFQYSREIIALLFSKSSNTLLIWLIYFLRYFFSSFIIITFCDVKPTSWMDICIGYIRFFFYFLQIPLYVFNFAIFQASITW